MDSLMHPTVVDRIIDDKKRSTKTFSPHPKFGILLANLESNAINHARQIQELHEQETKKKLTFDELRQRYPGVRLLFEVHQSIVDHLASTEGLGIKLAARMISFSEAQKKDAESSVKTEGGQAPAVGQ